MQRGYARYDELLKLKRALSDLLDDLELRAGFEEDGCVPCGDGVYQRARAVCPGAGDLNGKEAP